MCIACPSFYHRILKTIPLVYCISFIVYYKLSHLWAYTYLLHCRKLFAVASNFIAWRWYLNLSDTAGMPTLLIKHIQKFYPPYQHLWNRACLHFKPTQGVWQNVGAGTILGFYVMLQVMCNNVGGLYERVGYASRLDQGVLEECLDGLRLTGNRFWAVSGLLG